MTKDEHEYVCDVVSKEGFDYAFIDYSDFDDVHDEKFHALRLAYVEAHRALADYIGLDTLCDS